MTRRDGVMPASGREHLLTVVFGLWMTVGLFLDGYFHQNLAETSESFLTPWHAVFYAGFGASALWLATMSRRRAPNGVDRRLGFLPLGYEGAKVGITLFALGGVGDGAWHTAYGVERGIDALLSPTHLVLFAGLVLILTAPLRAAKAALASPPSRWMIVGSVVSATALVGFFMNFAWGLGVAAYTRVPYNPISGAGEAQLIAGVASMLVTTVVLFGAARLLLSSTQPPIGSFTALFGISALLVSVAFDEDAEGVAAALIAGLALDALPRLLSLDLRRPATAVTIFGLASAGMWLVYFGLLGAIDGLEWQAEIWGGAIVLNALAACALILIPPHAGAHPPPE